MSNIPGQKFTILDPGLGNAPAAITTPLFMGVCEGTVNKVYSLSRISDAIAQLGQGPLTEAVCTYLGTPDAGGPVLAVPLAGNVATALPDLGSALPQTAGTPVVGQGLKVKGAPLDDYHVLVVITRAATDDGASPPVQLTAAAFQYSLDGGYSYASALSVPALGSYAIPKTGITLVFTGTAFVVGDTFDLQLIAPFYDGESLNAGFLAAIASNLAYATPVLVGEAPNTFVGSTLAAGLSSQCDTLFTRFQFVRAMMGSGQSDTAQAITDYQNFASTRVLITYGRCAVVSKKPLPGWTIIDRSIVDVVAARAGASLISSDLGRVASGALDGVVAITHDEAVDEVMDQNRFTTLRTLQGRIGFYITQGKLMSSPDSDYKYWQYGRCMDVACATAYQMQLPFLNENTRTNRNGTIDARDAARFEGPVRSALAAVLLEPNAANGTPGHVSAVGYAIDRTNNVQTTDTLKTAVSFRPRGYFKNIVTELGMTANVGG